MIKVGMVSLGCAKNQVDAERMLANMQNEGIEIETDPSLCDAVIVNTCGFIEDAKKESIENILDFVEMKEEGNLKVVAVTGCLAERYREELAKEIPEIDIVLGIGSNDQLIKSIKKALDGEKIVSFGEKTDLSLEGDRLLANDPHFAYLKIAEGCDNRCTYCAIPLIRGEFRSRPMENVIEEAKTLAKGGVTELNVVAQDTTRYGEDIYGKLMLPELLTELCKIPELKWVRVLYCYPDRITDEFLDVMAKEDKIVKYIDIPLQHSSGDILKRMNRRGNTKELKALMSKIREKVDGVVLRTTLIAGFPGETDKDFEELCEFIEDVKFERLGCFAYSREEDTPACDMDDQIDEDVKRRRCDVIMDTQIEIAAEFSNSIIGRELEVLCEDYDFENDEYIGRSYMDAPDIDTRVFFTSDGEVGLGEYVKVKITDSLDYDLIGEHYGGEE